MSLKKGTSSPILPLRPRRKGVGHSSTSKLLLTSLPPTDSFPASAAFDAINQTLQADAAERKDAVDKAKAIVAFNLKNEKGEEASWYLDLKNKGEVGQGAAPAGGKADGEWTLPIPKSLVMGMLLASRSMLIYLVVV